MNANDLRRLNVPGHAVAVAQQCCRNAGLSRDEVSQAIQVCVEGRNTLEAFKPLQDLLAAPPEILPEPIPCGVWGADGIDAKALDQMQQACRVPFAAAAALMPDAHLGYGLPIGGVLATRNTVIPFAVGVDIACRMKVTIFDLPGSETIRMKDHLSRSLIDNTRFGVGAEFETPHQHPVMDHPAWQSTKVTRDVKDKAYRQLGSSGSGNHFVEFGELELHECVNGYRPGKFLALLSHSGSRGAGAQVCSVYSAVAKSRLPQYCRELGNLGWLDWELGNLGWLDLDSEAGQEYWTAMNLMGLYAQANHDCIHRSLWKSLGEPPIVDSYENHHNFAWKESVEMSPGKFEDLIVHRKGATPAGAGIVGIIPGSMASPAFLVQGKGNPKSLNSASHGAGRQMSRTAASAKYDFNTVKNDLALQGVTVLAAGADEVPYAYKDIHSVMSAQQDLVEVFGLFHPKIVLMSGSGPSED